MIIRSGDQGETWSEHPEVIGGYEYYGMDDPGIMQLSDGTILVNAFDGLSARRITFEAVRHTWQVRADDTRFRCR